MDVLNTQRVLRRKCRGSRERIASMGSKDPLVSFKAAVPTPVWLAGRDQRAEIGY
jgi:hypothetical protein